MLADPDQQPWALTLHRGNPHTHCLQGSSARSPSHHLAPAGRWSGSSLLSHREISGNCSDAIRRL